MPPKRRAAKKEELGEVAEEPVTKKSKISASAEKKPARTKKNAKKSKNSGDESEATSSLPIEKGKKEKTGLMNATETSWSQLEFTTDKKNQEGEGYNMKITSWNVDGMRAWAKKGGASIIDHDKPDIFCIQETKCSEEQLPPEVKKVEGYHVYWVSSDKGGYAGVGIFTRIKPLDVKYGIGDEDHDSEGRCITAEFEKFYLVNVYVPNAGRNLVTLPKRLDWNKKFKQVLLDLDSRKPIIATGDFNVAHEEIDLANPKTNTKNAGFTPEERAGMTDLLSSGFVDTFRHLYPDKTGAYTFWTYIGGARARNVGWRLDYFIVSKRILNSVCDVVLHSKVLGSDHCPLTLFISL